MLRRGGLCGAVVILFTATAHAQVIRQNKGFFANDLGPTDDGSTGPVPLGFEATFFGANYTRVFVNNNGYVAFDHDVKTLFSATQIDQRLFAVFFADVDTRGDAGTGTLHYGQDTVDGQPAFAATWPGVGYYERHDDKLDAFQIVLVDREDTGAGHFDVECNYQTISWESGDRSDGGFDGIGGLPSAIVGYSDGVTPSLFPGSGVPGTFLDSNPTTALVHGQSQSNVLGRYVFQFRQARIPDPTSAADAAAPDAAAVPPPPDDSSTPSALGCACELAAGNASGGLSALSAVGLLACVLCRRRSR